MRTICIFCGSSPGARPGYVDAVRLVGAAAAERGFTLVYGGSNSGLMGAVADAALARGARVVGIIPEALMAKEIAHTGLTELLVVGSMHERKARMAGMADGFLALPGGIGTQEEMFEILTWAMLGLHRKPVAILNIDGYFDPLLALLDHAVDEQFVSPANRALVLADSDIDRILDRMDSWRTPAIERWIGPNET